MGLGRPRGMNVAAVLIRLEPLSTEGFGAACFFRSCSMPSRCPAAVIVVALLQAALAGNTLPASEIICRYCGHDHAAAALLPPGMELDGKYQYAPARQVDVTHIKLDVTPSFADKTVSGTASITATVLAKPVDVVRLDAVNLNVASVRCEAATVKDFSSSATDLQVVFAEPLAAGSTFTLVIDYSAEPEQGLYFRTADMGYREGDTHLWTQGEAHEARHWFPCFDYPNERSSTEIICHVPADMTVLSNGQLQGETAEANGIKAVHWLQEQPHASYLICLVAGHFAKLEKRHRDVPLGFYTQPSLAEHAANSFADTPAIMAFLEEEIGVPFPWPKYDQVTIVDFSAGGMENTTLTTLTHNTIFTTATENLRTTRQLDAHEMAHQWFGDLVTCKDWSHLWLNEGFATYYTHLYEGHALGRDAMLYGLYQDAENRVLPRSDDSRPIVFNEYTNPMQQFDFRAYPKGGWILHMLRSQLGDDLYRRCIKAYLEKHAYTSVVSDDLRQVLEEHSGRSFDRFFDQWVYSPGSPELKIDYSWQAKQGLAKVTVTQTHKADNGVRIFAFPTVLRFVVDGEVIEHAIDVRKQAEDFYVALPAEPTVVRFDPHYTVLAKVAFKKSDALLKDQLAREDDMLGRLLAAKALGDRKTKESAELLQQALSSDPFFGVRIAAAEALAAHDSDESFEILTANWQAQADARVRKVVVEKATRRYHPLSRRVIDEVLAEEQNPEILGVATSALARFSDNGAMDQLLTQLRSTSFRNQLAVSAIRAIEGRHDATLVPELLAVLREQPDRFTTNGFADGLRSLGNLASTLDDTSQVREFLLQWVNDQRSGIQAAALRGLGNLGDEKAMAAVQAFTTDTDTRIATAAKEALRELSEKKPAAPEEVVALRKDLADLQESNKKLTEQLDELRKQVESLGAREKDGSAE
jgi:aminopeptidase N